MSMNTITYDEMIENHMSFYPVSRTFAADAVQSMGAVWIAGADQRVPLYIVVEWDTARVLVGYSRTHGDGNRRSIKGLEEWFLGNQVFLGNEHGVFENQDMTILEAARAAQLLLNPYLDSEDEVSDETKKAVRAILDRRTPSKY